MKLKVEFDNPLSPGNKVVKTITIRGKRKEYYAKQLFKMSSNSMLIIPTKLTITIDNESYSQDIMISTPAIKEGYRGQINHRPKPIPISPPSRLIKESEDGSEHIGFWARLLGR